MYGHSLLGMGAGSAGAEALSSFAAGVGVDAGTALLLAISMTVSSCYGSISRSSISSNNSDPAWSSIISGA